MKTVLVTGIGGNVGQGVLRVLRSLPVPLRLVGTDVSAISAGNHLCDVVRRTPFAWEPGYLARMEEICAAESVELVIPSTDHEAAELAAAADRLPPLAASPPEVGRAFLDKHLTATAMHAAGVAFAASALPSVYRGQFDATVVKPRTGRGSRDVHVDPADPSSFGDDFVVQRRYTGPEITSAFYVDRQGALHGTITMERELHAGTTVRCGVTRCHDQAVAAIVEGMRKAFPIRGSCNVQSIVTAGGAVVPFEVNCRVSGTASIRHHLGFHDVAWVVDELLLGRAPGPCAIVGGSALRILMDVVYPGLPCDVPRARDTAHILF